MTYQVVKEEIVRRRPRWLTQVLMAMPPEEFFGECSLSEAQTRLRAIKKVLQIFLSHKPRLRLVAEEDSLEILSPKNYTYIRFSINQINDRDELNYSEV